MHEIIDIGQRVPCRHRAGSLLNPAGGQGRVKVNWAGQSPACNPAKHAAHACSGMGRRLKIGSYPLMCAVTCFVLQLAEAAGYSGATHCAAAPTC